MVGWLFRCFVVSFVRCFAFPPVKRLCSPSHVCATDHGGAARSAAQAANVPKNAPLANLCRSRGSFFDTGIGCLDLYLDFFFKNGLLFTIRIISPLTAQLAHLEGISRGSRGSTANSSPGSGYLTPVQSPRSRGGSEDNATEEQKASGEYSIANFGRVIVTDVSTSVQTRSGIHVAAEAAV